MAEEPIKCDPGKTEESIENDGNDPGDTDESTEIDENDRGDMEESMETDENGSADMEESTETDDSDDFIGDIAELTETEENDSSDVEESIENDENHPPTVSIPTVSTPKVSIPTASTPKVSIPRVSRPTVSILTVKKQSAFDWRKNTSDPGEAVEHMTAFLHVMIPLDTIHGLILELRKQWADGRLRETRGRTIGKPTPELHRLAEIIRGEFNVR